MAQETVPITQVTRAGVVEAFTSVTTADGFRFKNDGKQLLVIATDAGALVVGFVTPGLIDGQAVADRSETQTAAVIWIYGPFPPAIYNDADGYVDVTIDADLSDADEGAAVFKMGG